VLKVFVEKSLYESLIIRFRFKVQANGFAEARDGHSMITDLRDCSKTSTGWSPKSIRHEILMLMALTK
jgi:hypothetical protein